MEVTEPGGIEVIGWSEDGERFLYRTEVRQEHEGAVVGVALRLDGSRQEYLVSLATDPGATPRLRTALQGRGVHEDASPFHTLARRAVLDHGGPSSATAGELNPLCGQAPIPVPDEGGRVVHRVVVAPDAGALAVVDADAPMGEGPATVRLDRLDRRLHVGRVPGDEALVAALRARAGDAWKIVEAPAPSPPDRTTLWTVPRAPGALWWAELGLGGPPVLAELDRPGGCAEVVLVPARP